MKLPVDMSSFLRKSSNNEKFVQSYRNSIHSRIKKLGRRAIFVGTKYSRMEQVKFMEVIL